MYIKSSDLSAINSLSRGEPVSLSVSPCLSFSLMIASRSPREREQPPSLLLPTALYSYQYETLDNNRTYLVLTLIVY